MNLYLKFPHTYNIEIPPEPTGHGGDMFYIPGSSVGSRHDGVLAHVNPTDAESWFGVFAFGIDDYNLADGIYSCPNPDQFCVSCGGDAYLVNSKDPNEWIEIPSGPVLDVRMILSHEIMIFVDFTEIVAIGRDGVLWKTDRLALDGIFISSIDGDVINGAGTCLCRDDAPRYDFVVDLKTGKHTGGWP